MKLKTSQPDIDALFELQWLLISGHLHAVIHGEGAIVSCCRCAILFVGPAQTVLTASSVSGRCNALASSHGARIIALLVGREDHRHRLGMDRLDHRIWCGGEKAIDEMRSWDRLGLCASVAFEFGPDERRRIAAGSRSTRTNHVFLLGVRALQSLRRSWSTISPGGFFLGRIKANRVSAGNRFPKRRLAAWLPRAAGRSEAGPGGSGRSTFA